MILKHIIIIPVSYIGYLLIYITANIFRSNSNAGLDITCSIGDILSTFKGSFATSFALLLGIKQSRLLMLTLFPAHDTIAESL